MLLDALNLERMFESCIHDPRPSRSFPAAVASAVLGAFFLKLYLRNIDFHPATISFGMLGAFDVTSKFLIYFYCQMAFGRLVVYPLIYHGVMSQFGGEAGLARALDAHSRLTVVAVVIYIIGTELTYTSGPLSLAWQSVFSVWGIWTQFPLARSVYGLSGTRAVLAFCVIGIFTIYCTAAIPVVTKAFVS